MSRKHGRIGTFTSTPTLVQGRPWTPPWEAPTTPAARVSEQAAAARLARQEKYGQRLDIEYMEYAKWKSLATDRALWHVGLVFWGHCDRLSRLEMAIWASLLHRQRGDGYYSLPQIMTWVHTSKGNVTRALRTLARRSMIVNLGTGKKRVLAVNPIPEAWRLGPVLAP